MTALVTPMRDGQVDEAALEALVEAQIAAGIDALVPVRHHRRVGDADARGARAVVRRVVQARQEARAGDRRRRIELDGRGDRAVQGRARGRRRRALCTSRPTTIDPTQEGLYLHFKAIAEAVPLPIVLYNVPARTGCDLLPRDPRAAGRAAVGRRRSRRRPAPCSARSRSSARLGDRLAILSGEDAINCRSTPSARAAASRWSSATWRRSSSPSAGTRSPPATARARASCTTSRCRSPTRCSPRRARSRPRRRWR